MIKMSDTLMSNEEVDRLFDQGVYKMNTAKADGPAPRLSDRKLNLPEAVTERFVGKDGQTYKIRYMQKTVPDLNATTEVFRQGFPELYASVFEAFVKPVELEKIADRYKILVVEDEKQSIVASAVLEPNETNMDVTWHLVAVPPTLRKKGIFKGLAEYVDRYIRESGADYASLVASTFQKENQAVFEALGFELVGIYPGHIVAPQGDGAYNRQPVTCYAKSYKDPKQFVPRTYSLTERGRCLEKAIEACNGNKSS